MIKIFGQLFYSHLLSWSLKPTLGTNVFRSIIWKSPSLGLSTIRINASNTGSIVLNLTWFCNIYFIHLWFILSISLIEFLNTYWYSFIQLQTWTQKYLAQLSLGLLWVFPPAISNYDTSQLCHNMAVSLLVTPHTTLIERFWLKYFPCFCPNYYLIGWANCINILIEDRSLHSISNHGVKLCHQPNIGLLWTSRTMFLTLSPQLLLHSNWQYVFDK